MSILMLHGTENFNHITLQLNRGPQGSICKSRFKRYIYMILLSWTNPLTNRVTFALVRTSQT